MDKIKIGIIADCFRVETTEAIAKAARLGADAVQMYVGNRGDVRERWTVAYRSRIKNALSDAGLSVSAMCGDLGGHGFSVPDDNIWKIPETIAMLPITRELGCDVLTTHIGVIPQDDSHPRFAILQDALGQLAIAGEREGCRIAIETGPEPPETLRHFLDGLPGAWIGVNYDPANLRMVLGVDPVAGVETLKDSIFHTHVKDGKLLKYVGPETVYGFFADGGIGDVRIEECFLETPLGQGDVDLPRWFAALNRIGYGGYYTIEREVGAQPEKDIAAAIAFIKLL
ncbi:MAG: sugar phosphate isomerase/epimerase [Oscillospiraceae bacterium]|jgi:sugar phosphate isomerase/epimerase|nr:sugar phosphate isomerase/epimerase [Oscillospiraceae bacterium]